MRNEKEELEQAVRALMAAAEELGFKVESSGIAALKRDGEVELEFYVSPDQN